MDPRTEYTSRLRQRQEVYENHSRLERAISYSRGIVFAAGVLILWLATGNHVLPVWSALIPLAVFVGLVLWHDRVLRARAYAARCVSYYEKGLVRLDDGWPKTDAPYQPNLDPAHPYGADLDLFGSESLFERISSVRTESGRATLSDWLLNPATTPDIRERQSAVAELRPRLDLREDLAVLGPDLPPAAGSPMRRWASTTPSPVSPIARSAAPIIAAAVLLTFIGWLFWNWSLNWFAIALFCEWLFSRMFRAITQSVMRDLDRAGEELALLLPVLQRIERESFSSTRLIQLHERLKAQGSAASKQIGRLRRLIELMDSMRNPYFAPLGALLLWRTQVAFAIEAWRAECGRSVQSWLATVGEMEALASFAGFSFEHPADPFPEIVEEGPCFDGHELGHPLLPDKICVRNDLRLDRDLRLLVVSGSNMSGKSTLLRTVGINAVLALAGSTVRATKLRVSPLAVGASLHIIDSLQSGASHFYAEITRLRLLMDTANGPLPLLFLLDEILHGTNSSDRRTGAEAVVRGYLGKGAIGLITTHDLALAQIADALAPRAANVHFEDHMEDGRIAFDYRVRPGIITRSNAIALMRAIGLDV
jgi:MutS domain V